MTIAFIRPLSLLSDLIEYQLIHTTGKDVLEGESAKDANERRCRRVIDTYQPDAIVMCRYANKDGLFLSSLCKEKNIKVIYYIDDLLFEPSLEVLDENKYLNYKKIQFHAKIFFIQQVAESAVIKTKKHKPILEKCDYAYDRYIR